MIDKTERDGKVGVLVSPGFGAGWSTWMDDEHAKVLMFSPKIIELVEADKRDEITEDLCKELLGLPNKSYVCTLGTHDLEVHWVDTGEAFEITEYDGSECLNIISQGDYNTA